VNKLTLGRKVSPRPSAMRGHPSRRASSGGEAVDSMPAMKNKGQRGFTLIELMVTVAVLVIVMTLSAPAMRSFTRTNQVTAAKDALVSSLTLARIEATLGNPVVVQAEAPVAGNQLGKGWNLQVPATATRVRNYPALAADVTIQGATTLTFQATGWLTPVAQVTFLVCPAAGGNGYEVVVPPSGITEVVSKVCS